MAEQPAGKMDERVVNLAQEIRNLAHNAWTDRVNAEYLFREIEKRALLISGALITHAAVAEKEALKLWREAYQECAKLVCKTPDCLNGSHYDRLRCQAAPIHTAIALLDLEIAKGGTPK